MKKAIQHLGIINVNDYWETPKSELEFAVDKYDIRPEIDVCSTYANRKFDFYFSEQDDALTKQWSKDFFMNPPYSQIYDWMKYAYEQHQEHNVNALILTFGKIGVRWFNEFVYDRSNDKWLAEFKPVDHRIKFMLNGIVPKNCKNCKKSFYDVREMFCPQCSEKMSETTAPYDSCWIIFRGRK